MTVHLAAALVQIVPRQRMVAQRLRGCKETTVDKTSMLPAMVHPVVAVELVQ
jgi:hypothetical protein